MNSHFFKLNRTRLIEQVGAEAIVLTAFTKMQLAGDAAQPFWQEANFWYLSGIEYPDWRLIIDAKQGRSWLVAPEKDEAHQLFDGSLSAEAAKTISGVDKVVDRKQGQSVLRELAKKYDSVHTIGGPPYSKYVDFHLNPSTAEFGKELKKYFDTVHDCQDVLAKLRAIKQPEEIGAIKAAAALSVDAFETAKEKLKTSCFEYEIEAEMTYAFRRQNATHAFDPIVAGGQSACTLHYTANTSQLRKDEMLLIDAGARLASYSADITRTLALGNPTGRQLAVHAAVQTAQKEIIKLIRPGLALEAYVKSADDCMEAALEELGLLKKRDDTAAFRRYFPHAVSHGLGLEVHERLGGFKEFMPGMVLTVEPGIYISEEGIGVRIEDDIIVTEQAHENLTAALSTEL